MCAIERVNGQDKGFKCLCTGYGSRCHTHRFESVKNCNAAGVFTQQFPVCIKNGLPPKVHPANLTKLWEVLCQHGPAYQIEAVLRAKRGAIQY